jgi:eukaryotic-like serine/threonine-protein kinase
MLIHNLASSYGGVGQYAQATVLETEVVERAKRVLNGDHPLISTAEYHLAELYHLQGDYSQAERHFRGVIQTSRRGENARSIREWSAMTILADCLIHQNQSAEAETLLRECLAVFQKEYPESWWLGYQKSLLGGALLGQKKHQEAESLLRSGYEEMTQRSGNIPLLARNVRLAGALERLILFCIETNKPQEVNQWQCKKENLRRGSP